MSMMGEAAVFTTPGQPLEIRRYPVLEPAGDAVRLRLACSGICGTDLHIAEGRLAIPPSFIPGHEFIGTVEALGETAGGDAFGRPIHAGMPAIACVALPCGQCFNCRRGETASCLNFGVTFVRNPDDAPHFFGGFATHLFSPAGNLVMIPPDIALDAVAAFPCAGPTVIRACAYAGDLQPDELVVVQGTGPVGMFAVAWAAALGCTVVAIGSGANPARSALARQLGAAAVLDYRATTPEERQQTVRAMAADLGRGDGADVLIEASGAPAAVAEGMNLVRTRGRYLVPGQYSASGGIEIQPQMITFKAISIVGSGQYTIADLGVYLDFLQRHPALQQTFASCITHRYAVADANQALRDANAGVFVKGVFSA